MRKNNIYNSVWSGDFLCNSKILNRYLSKATVLEDVAIPLGHNLFASENISTIFFPPSLICFI